MNFPDNLKYTKDHEWLRVEGTTAFIGISDYAQSELGDVVYVDITADGALIKGETFGSIEAVKTVSDIFAPVSGTLVEVNKKIQDTPETINKDPYGDGWIVKISLTNPSDTEGLMDAATYRALIGH